MIITLHPYWNRVRAMENDGSQIGARRACTTCARSKAKCVTGNQIGGKCQRSAPDSQCRQLGNGTDIKSPRCQRLDKPCEPAIPMARKRKHDGEKKCVIFLIEYEMLLTLSRRVTKAQVEKLEQKVESLVTMLASTQGAVSSGAEMQRISSDADSLTSSTFYAKQGDFGKCSNIRCPLPCKAGNGVIFYLSRAL